MALPGTIDAAMNAPDPEARGAAAVAAVHGMSYGLHRGGDLRNEFAPVVVEFRDPSFPALRLAKGSEVSQRLLPSAFCHLADRFDLGLVDANEAERAEPVVGGPTQDRSEDKK